MIFVFGVAGLAIFMLYERLMERTEKEHTQIQDTSDRIKKELVASYQYIGLRNNTGYWFRVSAVNGSGTTSSAVKTAKTLR